MDFRAAYDLQRFAVIPREFWKLKFPQAMKLLAFSLTDSAAGRDICKGAV